MCIEQVIEIFSGFLTPMIGITTATIIIFQYRLARQRWKLALYDKRYPVFESTMKYITGIFRSATLTNAELSEFLRNTKDREFLFGNEVKEFLDKLYDNGNKMTRIESVLPNEPVGDKRSKLVDDKVNLVAWFADQGKVATVVFGSYLKMDKK